MKKRLLLIISMILVIFSFENVRACGEITELKSSVGVVTTIGEMKYLVTVPEGTTEVTLEGLTDYAWVTGYEPRTVSTKNGTVELKVDGASCGYGTYTYFIEFSELANILAENDQLENSDDQNADEPDGTITEPNYGVLYLSKLEILGIDFDFNPDTRTYDLEVDGTISKLDITAYTQDSSVTTIISDNAYDLKEGINTITISLSDPYDNTGLYILKINKTKPKSSNNFLASLTIDKYQLNFDPSITTYTIEIGKESVLNITPVTESELANVTILGNSALSDGDSITVRVTAENGNTKDYIITVKRSFNIMDYWIYIIIALLILLLLLILKISKNKKSKKKMGPETIEGQTTTAGVVQEVAPQNQNTTAAQPTTVESTLTSSTNTMTPSTLKIIEPTNLDAPVTEPPQEVFAETESVSADDGQTEVFQL